MFVNFVPVVRKRKGWDSLHFGIILIKHKVCMAVILKLDVFTSQLKKLMVVNQLSLPPFFWSFSFSYYLYSHLSFICKCL